MLPESQRFYSIGLPYGRYEYRSRSQEPNTSQKIFQSLLIVDPSGHVRYPSLRTPPNSVQLFGPDSEKAKSELRA